MFEIPNITKGMPSTQDRIQDAVNVVSQKMTDNMVNFDNDIIIALAVIVNALCQGGTIQRAPLIEVLQNLHEQRLLSWTNGYSPLGLLADILHQSGEAPPPNDGKISASWLKEVIEGGLSKPRSTD